MQLMRGQKNIFRLGHKSNFHKINKNCINYILRKIDGYIPIPHPSLVFPCSSPRISMILPGILNRINSVSNNTYCSSRKSWSSSLTRKASWTLQKTNHRWALLQTWHVLEHLRRQQGIFWARWRFTVTLKIILYK